jgi:methionine sulfoxide reductase heme-binding subunit
MIERDLVTVTESLSRNRIVTHILMAIVSGIGYYITYLLEPDLEWKHVLTIGLGYVSLIQLAGTLLIGPWQLMHTQSRNPVNINLRRDIGIWAAITGTLHVIFGFQVHLNGVILHYFFQPGTWRPWLNPFGASNVIGVGATLLLLLLLVLSNDISLRTLKGKRWKYIQRFNYVLFGAVVLHTFGYQFVVKRTLSVTVLVLVITLVVLICQAIGYRIYRAQRDASRVSPQNV